MTTLTALTEHLWDDFTVKKALVIAPKNVAQNVWAQECRKWEHTQGIRCALVMGTAAQRLRALSSDADLYIINRENVVWLVDTLQNRLPFDMVIVDELSSFKSTKAKRWKAIKKLIQTVPYVIGLTGTPAPNSYLDLWPQIYLLDGGARLGRTVSDYRYRYFKPGAHKGHVVYEWIMRLGAQDAINRKLKDLCLSMSAEDWLDLPDTIYNTIPVSMDAAAEKRYKRFERTKVMALLQEATGFRELDVRNPEQLAQMTSAIRGDTAAAIAGKLLQMAGGAVYDDDGQVVPIHEAKLDALSELLEANEGENVLCFYNYQHEKQRILERFPQAVAFSGTEVEAWNDGRIPLLLCHPASTGHGLNLQSGGHITVWYGLNWSLELYQQANARLSRPGQTHSVVIHHLVCRDTIDERVMAALQKKNEGQEALLKALKDYLGGEV